MQVICPSLQAFYTGMSATARRWPGARSDQLICRRYFAGMFWGGGCVMKWTKERDDLIAQTRAFVQSVTGRRPEIAAPPLPVERVRTENPVFAAHPASTPASTGPHVLFEPIEKIERTDVPPPIEALPARVFPQSEVRKEIESRVAAFQAHQHRFHREREAYFKSVLTKVRSAIKDGPDAPSP
jgi:hypothetical protein